MGKCKICRCNEETYIKMLFFQCPCLKHIVILGNTFKIIKHLPKFSHTAIGSLSTPAPLREENGGYHYFPWQ